MVMLRLGETHAATRCDLFLHHHQHLQLNHRKQVQFRRLHFVPISTRGQPRLSVSRSTNGSATGTEAQSVLGQQELQIKNKGEELRRDLQGTSVFLIGMMGCGKTTVGKVVADAMGYYFFDSDKLIEQAAGGASVAQIFKENSEEDFRNAESEVLSQLSGMGRLVVATGGGAVIRSQNWGYLRHGITVWIDVPLDALARRVMAAGTEKRPLLNESADEASSHPQTLARLQKLYEARRPSYAEADVTVSVLKIASEMGVKDPKDLTSSVIALQILKQIHELVTNQRHYGKPRYGL